MTSFDFLNKKESYILLNKELNAILGVSRLPKNVLNIILDDKTLDKLSVGDILEKYEYFTRNQLTIIKKYIHSHLDDGNQLFVSDLIDCANGNNIESETIFEFCINAIKKHRTSTIVLSSILYVFEHMRISQCSSIVPVFKRVIKNKSYYQDCQIIAAFCLFRITMDPQYLQLIKKLVSLNNNLYTVLKNKMLYMDYNNNENCFFYCKDVFF